MSEKKSCKKFCFVFSLEGMNEMQTKSSISSAKALKLYHLWFTGQLCSKYSFSCSPSAPTHGCWAYCVISVGDLMCYCHLPTPLPGAWPHDLIYSMRCSQFLVDQWCNVSMCAHLPFTLLAHLLLTHLLAPQEHALGICWFREGERRWRIPHHGS